MGIKGGIWYFHDIIAIFIIPTEIKVLAVFLFFKFT